jgi:hypothetical protein
MNEANRQPPSEASRADRHRDRARPRPTRRLDAACELMEGRQLLSVAGGRGVDPAAAAQVHRDVRQLTNELHRLGRHSHVTPSQFMAFERDMYDVMDSPLSLISPNDPAVINLEVETASLVDSAFFDASLNADGWAAVTTNLQNNLTQLAYSPTQVSASQIISDMQQIAHAAGVSNSQAQVVYTDVAKLYYDQTAPGAPTGPDAWSQVILPSLHGFVHGRG